ncbi:MAG: carboxypeptidase regulatory-like domain-containing protein [Bryobacteraceae bacterium]
MIRWLVVAATCLPTIANTSLFTEQGAAYTRSDYSSISVSYNNDIRAGMRNTNQRVMITVGSDPAAAFRAAANTWSSVEGSRIRFGGISSTVATNDTKDLQNVMLMGDTPEIRSIVGDSVAVTLIMTLPTTGVITDADIFFSPSLADQGFPFSTTGASGTIDLQAIATHELGHLLGAGHSHLLAASLFPTGGSGARRTLSSDDMAFARRAAPAAGTESLFGLLRGVVSLTNGQPAKRVAVTATDPTTGVAVGALTDATGAYSMPRIPGGSYVVFAEPLDGPATPGHFQLQAADAELNVEADYFDGKRRVTVAAGAEASATFALRPRVGTINIVFIGQGSAGGSGDYSSIAPMIATAGTSFDLMIAGPGIDSSVGQQDIELIGADAVVRAGTVRVDPRLVFPDGSRVVRFTVDLADSLNRSMVSLIVGRGGGMSTVAGALVVEPTVGQILGLKPSSIVNAATATAGPVAPDSWVSIFAKSLAREFVLAPASISTQIDGTSVLLTDARGVAQFAKLQFVSPEQINFLMPANVPAGTARITVMSLLGQGSTDIQVATVAPGIFAANSDGRGPAAAAYVRVLAGGAQQSGFTFDADRSPRENLPIDVTAAAPVYLTLYGTGIRYRATAVAATIGGLSVPVLAAVAQGQYAGLDQVNVGPLPIALAGRGEVSVNFQVDGRATNPVTVNVR